MEVRLDNAVRRKLFLAKNEERYFAFEFPADADAPELYGVADELKKALWEIIEEQKKKEEEKKAPEDTTTEEVKEVKEEPK